MKTQTSVPEQGAGTESLLRILVDSLSDFVFIKDRECRIVIDNLAHARALGFGHPDEAVGMTDFDCFPREQAEKYHAGELALLRTGRTLNVEEPYFNQATQETRWLRTTKMALRDGAGNVSGLVGISHDITEQKQAEEALHRSRNELEQRVAERTAELSDRNAQLAALQETSLDLISQLDLNRLLENILKRAGQLMGTSTGCLDLLEPGDDHLTPKIALGVLAEESLKHQVRRGEGLGGKVWQTGQPILVEDYDAWPGRIQGHEENLIRSIVEIPLMSKSGFVGILGLAHEKSSNRTFGPEAVEKLSEFARCATIAIENARLYSTSQRELAERQRVEDALRESQALFRSLVEQMPSGVFRKDREGRYVFVNPWFCRLKRMKQEEILGKTPRELEAYELGVQGRKEVETIDKMAAQGTNHHDLILQTGQPIEVQEEYVGVNGKTIHLHVVKSPVFGLDGTIVGTQSIMADITAIKEAERKVEMMHRELLAVSRQAGMAEVATGILHNVGNVLNSVNVTVALIDDQLRNSRIEGVVRLASLLREQGDNLGRYFTEDERGRQVPAYLESLGQYLERERADLRREVAMLKGNIGHIKEIVSMQQENARMFALVETVSVSDLAEDALKLNDAGYARHGLTVKREYDPLPAVAVDKHKALQILVNLLSNAKYACDGPATDKMVTVRLKAGGEGRVQIDVVDNGVGIAPENLTRIFAQGFTTRKGGHGFGLHTSALTARELGGSLTVHSDGLGRGATFTLILPVTPPPAPPTSAQTKQYGVE